MMLLPAVLAVYENQAEKDHATALFEAHHMAMYHAAKRILSVHEDAEDTVQDAFIIIHDHLWRLEDVLCFKTRGFVVLVAKFVAKNKLRKRRRERTISFEDIPYEIPCTQDDIASQLDVEVVLAELHDLPETARDILLMKYQHQCSDKELAAIMGIKHDAARKRVERARALLLERLVTQ
jgi:RNA polymerase sigma-70 factor (ECF subfamily)